MPPLGISWSLLPWRDIIPRVVLFARSLLRRKPFAGADISAEDLTWSAIEKTLSGIRQWNVEHTGIVEHLMGVVSSDLYNSIRKRAAVPTESLFEIAADQIASDDLTPEEQAVGKSELLSLLRYLKENDDRVAELATLTVSFGATQPSELAELMSLPVSEIYLLKRKLRRLTERYLARG
jgi:DNA-directed RNA polymerase specialized sigma24 family protein